VTFNVNPRESISRCEVYENKFRAYPEEARLKETRRIQANDTIESEANQKERFLVEKFRQGILNVDTGGLRYVKQVGRFIFSAFTLPVYFMAFQAPKWVIEYGFPFVADISGFLMGKFAPLSSALAAWVVSVSGTLQEQFNRYFLRKLEKFHGFLKSSKDFLKERFTQGFERVRARLKRMAAPFSRFKEREKRRFQAAWGELKKRLPVFKFPAFKWPKIPFKWPRFQWPKWQLPALRVPSLAPVLIKFLKPIYSVIKAIGRFIYEVGKANYEIWVEPWVLRFLRLAAFIKQKGMQGYGYLYRKIEAIGIPLAAFAKSLKWRVPRLKISVSFPKITLPKMPRLPTFSVPQIKVQLPKISLPRFKRPRFSFPSLKAPIANAWLYFRVFLKVLFEQLS
jgi:hypothetical protein